MSITETIKDYCDKYFNTRANNYISTPTVITFYLGEEAYNYANASIKDAFASSFTTKIDNYEALITRNQESVHMIGQTIMNCVKQASNGRRMTNTISIMFITVMDDPILRQDNSDILQAIKEAIRNIEDYGIIVNCSLYGIFRQDHLKCDGKYYDYGPAFAFINKGKSIWKNIFHLEIRMFDNAGEDFGKLIAMNRIAERAAIRQNKDSNEYIWRSIAIHSLQIPEYVICSILSDIYKKQIGGSRGGIDNRASIVKNAIEESMNQIFHRNDTNHHMFIPLEFVEVKDEPKGGFSLFGGKNRQTLNFSKIMKDNNSLVQMAEQNYQDIIVDDILFQKIIENIISSLSSVDSDYVAISHLLFEAFSTYKKQCEQMLSALPKDIESYNMGMNINAYLDNSYKRIQKCIVLQRKIEIVESMQQRLRTDDYLKNIIDDIKEKNNQLIGQLEELIGRYGGSVQPIEFKEFTAERLNQPVDELLKSLNIHEIRAVVDNPDMLYARLDQFLAFHLGASNTIEYSHNLGGITGQYQSLEPVKSTVLMTPAQYTDIHIQQVVENKYHLERIHNALYRPYSFYILSSRAYVSDLCISRYRRGETD